MSRRSNRGPRGAFALLLLTVTAATVVATAGCGEDAGSGTAVTTAPIEADTLRGNYTTTLGPSGPELKDPNPPGKWGLMITSDTEAYFQPPEGASFPIGNPIELTGDQIVAAPDPECPTQEGTPGKGIYRWQLQDGTLTLTEVEDTCRDRAFVLTANPWVTAP